MPATDISRSVIDQTQKETPMRVFVTGATGFIGSAVVAELLDAAQEVVGLARSDEGAEKLAATGAEVQRGTLEDLDTLRNAAGAADGVIHTAYIHDFSQMEMAARTDLQAVQTLGAALEGSGRPLVVTTGIALVNPGNVATELNRADPERTVPPRVRTELEATALAGRDVRTSVIRPAPSVHGEGDHGFVPRLIDIAREKGVSGYVADGANRWPGAHGLGGAG